MNKVKLLFVTTLLVIVSIVISGAFDSTDKYYIATVNRSLPNVERIIFESGATIINEFIEDYRICVSEQGLERLAVLQMKPHSIVAAENNNFISKPKSMVSYLKYAPSIVDDSDEDGITDIEEEWWLTDPSKKDSDNDGIFDGVEIEDIKKGNSLNGYPFFPSFLSEDNDQDRDSVPDIVEKNILGLAPKHESTDGDPYDDGLEVFGITKVGWGNLYGSYPNHVTYLGKNPLVAAIPDLRLEISESEFKIIPVSIITIDEHKIIDESFTYGFSQTSGALTTEYMSQSQSFNSYQEIGTSESLDRASSSFEEADFSQTHNYTNIDVVGVKVTTEDTNAVGLETSVTVGVGTEVGITPSISAELSTTVSNSLERVVGRQDINERNTTTISDSGTSFHEKKGGSVTISKNLGQELKKGSGQETTMATGVSVGRYNEVTINKSTTYRIGKEWGKATSTDTAHAADLIFSFNLINKGTDRAEKIKGVFFNLFFLAGGQFPETTFGRGWVNYSPNPAVTTWVELHDKSLNPGETFSAAAKIPLSLVELGAIDQRMPFQIRIAGIAYENQNQYINSVSRCILIEVDDGVQDNEEEIDSFYVAAPGLSGSTIVPTHFQDILTSLYNHYFSISYDVSGILHSIKHPQFDQLGNVISSTELIASSTSWFTIMTNSLNQEEAEKKEPFRNRLAKIKSGMFLRYDQDNDGDGYSDRVERKILGIDAVKNPNLFPNPHLISAIEILPVTENSTRRDFSIRIENQGNYQASNLQVLLIAPNDRVKTRLNNSKNTIKDISNLAFGSATLYPGKIISSKDIVKDYLSYEYNSDFFAFPYFLVQYSTPNKSKNSFFINYSIDNLDGASSFDSNIDNALSFKDSLTKNNRPFTISLWFYYDPTLTTEIIKDTDFHISMNYRTDTIIAINAEIKSESNILNYQKNTLSEGWHFISFGRDWLQIDDMYIEPKPYPGNPVWVGGSSISISNTGQKPLVIDNIRIWNNDQKYEMSQYFENDSIEPFNYDITLKSVGLIGFWPMNEGRNIDFNMKNNPDIYWYGSLPKQTHGVKKIPPDTSEQFDGVEMSVDIDNKQDNISDIVVTNPSIIPVNVNIKSGLSIKNAYLLLNLMKISEDNKNPIIPEESILLNDIHPQNGVIRSYNLSSFGSGKMEFIAVLTDSQGTVIDSITKYFSVSESNPTPTPVIPTYTPFPTATITPSPIVTPPVFHTDPKPVYTNLITDILLENNNIWIEEGTYANLNKALVTVTDILPSGASLLGAEGNALRVTVNPGEGSLIFFNKSSIPANKKALVCATIWSNNEFPGVITGLIDADSNGIPVNDGISMDQWNVAKKLSKTWRKINSLHDSQSGYVLPFVQVVGGSEISDVYIDNVEVYILDENLNYSGKFLGVQ